MDKAANDPNCGLDTKLTFVKPDGMPEIQIDYSNGNVPIANGDVEDDGNAKSSDYETPKVSKQDEVLPPESDGVVLKETTPPANPKPADPKDTKKQPEKAPASLPNNTDKKPKMVMPPPTKKTGTGK
jgi:penicillin-binding protein 1A